MCFTFLIKASCSLSLSGCSMAWWWYIMTISFTFQFCLFFKALFIPLTFTYLLFFLDSGHLSFLTYVVIVKLVWILLVFQYAQHWQWYWCETDFVWWLRVSKVSESLLWFYLITFMFSHDFVVSFQKICWFWIAGTLLVVQNLDMGMSHVHLLLHIFYYHLQVWWHESINMCWLLLFIFSVHAVEV
jgi:hypothetical protein